jgi:hypothetical protein
MERRTFLAGLGSIGIAATAGCGAVAGETTLSEPTVDADLPGRKALIFESDGEEIGHVGVDGTVENGLIDLSTEIWHREGTRVERIELRVWMPETESAADVAVVSPVEGDSSPPPSVALYTPDSAPGTAIEITDLDDLADETISTLELLVRPPDAATKLAIDATVELAGSGALTKDYDLEGELRLSYPELDAE